MLTAGLDGTGKLGNDTDVDNPEDVVIYSASLAVGVVVTLNGNPFAGVMITDMALAAGEVAHYDLEVDGKHAELIINADGSETLVNTEGAFDFLAAGDTLDFKIDYQIWDGDEHCLEEEATKSFQTIRITGENDCPVAMPDGVGQANADDYTIGENDNLSLTAGLAGTGKLGNDTDVDNPEDVEIYSADSAAGVEVFLNGNPYAGVTITDMALAAGEVAHYDLEVGGKHAELIINKDGSETLINEDGAFDFLDSGDHLDFKIDYQIWDGDEHCLDDESTMSYQTIRIEGEDEIMLPGNLSNLVLYLDDATNGADCDIVKVKIEGLNIGDFDTVDDIYNFIEDNQDIFGDHTELTAFSYKAGNNLETGALGKAMHKGEGQLVYVEDGITVPLQNDVTSLSDIAGTCITPAELSANYDYTFVV